MYNENNAFLAITINSSVTLIISHILRYYVFALWKELKIELTQ